MAKKKQTKDEEIADLKAQLLKSNTNLEILKMYFREYDILEHYLAWLKAAANKTKKPKKLKV